MDILFGTRGDWHTVSFQGEMDHHFAASAAERTGAYFDANLPLHLCFDMRGVGFMDSSGIALILGTARRLKSIGGRLRVEGLQRQPLKVLRASGLDGYIEIAQEEGSR